MSVGLVGFYFGGLKLDRFFAKTEPATQRKSLYFLNTMNGALTAEKNWA